MSFANGRNFDAPFRLIGSRVGFGESADRRLELGFRALGLGFGVATCLWCIGLKTCLRLAGPRDP